MNWSALKNLKHSLYVVLFIFSLFNDAASNDEWVGDSELAGVWEGNGRG
jgi:hypothetical protein